MEAQTSLEGCTTEPAWTRLNAHRSLLEVVVERGEQFMFPEVGKRGAAISQGNLLYFLQTFDIQLAYDEFWGEARVFGVPHQKHLTGEVIEEIYTCLDLLGLRMPQNHLASILRTMAKSNRVHPVRESYDRLENDWDEVSRLDSWLSDYCGVKADAYSSEVGSLALMAMVRRVRVPGEKFDLVPVFEGPGGFRKSTLISRLALDARWYTSNLRIGASPKEVMELTRGKTVVELEEMAENMRAHPEEWKAFLSRQTDAARLSYDRETSEQDRQFVFWGSTNKSQYIRDETTGDRRLCPLRCEDKIDVNAFMSVRGQLFGEAARRERLWREEGRPLILSQDAEHLQRTALNERFERTDQQAEIENALGDLAGFVPSEQLYAFLDIPRGKRGPSTSRPVAQIMTRLGWKQHSQYLGSRRRVRGWLLGDSGDVVISYDPDTLTFTTGGKREYSSPE